MFLLAASALEKAAQVPGSFWLKLVLAVLCFVVLVIVLRWLAGVNKLVLGAVVCIGFGLLWFQWIYERNEPEFLTPIIDPIAQFFPSKGAYERVQSSEPERPKAGKQKAPAK
jgi:uncharacterized membrane protein